MESTYWLHKVSPGCKLCYAERLSKRLNRMGVLKYANEFDISFHEDALEIPLHWKRSRLIFVNSMSDLFHEHVARTIRSGRLYSDETSRLAPVSTAH